MEHEPELEHLMSTTSAPERIELCGHCHRQPRVLVTWQSHTIDTGLCEKCGADESSRMDAAHRDRRDAYLRRFLLDIGPRYERYTFETFPASDPTRAEALTRVRDAALNDVFVEHRNLVVFGDVGAGKTGLAIAAARSLIEEGMAARFFVVRDWLDLIRASFDEPNNAEQIAKTAGLLVLDDLGAERTTEFALEKLLGLIDHRYKHLRPTIVTSNFEPGELVEHLDERDPRVGRRIVSRMMDDAIPIRLEASDLRVSAERSVRAA